MGRTSARKVMKIVELRGLGYTQQEIAARMKIDVKTVRKYDPKRGRAGDNIVPLQPPRGEAPQPTMEERMIAFESRLSKVERHLKLASAYMVMLIHHGSSQEYGEEDQWPKNFLETLQNSSDNGEIWCPFCGAGCLRAQRLTEGGIGSYICDACEERLDHYHLFNT